LLTFVLLGDIGAAQRTGDIVDVAIRRWNVGGMVGGIAAGPDGHMWFSLPTAVAIGRLDPATGAIRTYPLIDGVPSALQVGKDGSVWFVSGEAGWIGRLNERTGKVDRIKIDDNYTVTKLSVAPNGNVWFTCPQLGLLNARTLAASYPADFGQSVLDIAATPQGSVFFIEADSHTIVEIDQRLLQVASNALPPSSRLDTISTSTGGAALFTDSQRGFVGVVNHGIAWEELSIRPPGTDDSVFDVSAGRDGYLWAGVTTAEGLAVSRLRSSILNPSLEDRGPSRRQRFMIKQGPVSQAAMIVGNASDLWFISQGSPVLTRVIGIAASERR
jgi:streptogramin lyase